MGGEANRLRKRPVKFHNESQASGDTAISLPPFAKFDQSAVVVLGLFRSLDSNAEAPEGRVEFKREFKDGDVEMTLSCGRPLGASDLRVFQALVAQATDSYVGVAAARLHARLGDGAPESPVRVNCTLKRLAQVGGLGSPGAGPTNELIRHSLKRLSDVTIAWRSATDITSPEPEAFITSDGSINGHGSVNVTFHSRLQAAILASRPGEHYLKVGMHEARCLRRPCARLLHHRLAHMNEGAQTEHGYGTLEEYLWTPSSSRHAARSRGAKLVPAIKELRGIGWRFEKCEDRDCFLITRPTANVHVPVNEATALPHRVINRSIRRKVFEELDA